MTAFEVAEIRQSLLYNGFAVETQAGFGPEDERTVFLAKVGAADRSG